MDYEKLYKEALERTKYFMSTRGVSPNEDPFEVAKELSETAFPELKEFEGESIRKRLIELLKNNDEQHYAKEIAWLEEKGEQKPTMIQWKGNNLKEVIDFTGVYKEGFEKWFHNSWEEYEKYVHEHNNIFKIFNEDGSHIEVPVGAWIIKTPDGYNTASRYVFRQKPAEWSEEDERMYKAISIALTRPEAEAYLASWYKTPKDADAWLKSIKDRVQPQSHWKPSEGQLECLDYAIDKAEKDYSPLDNNRIHLTLKALKEQLKKL